MNPFAHQILRAIRAGARGLLLSTVDETRAHELCETVGRQLDRPVRTWSCGLGIDHDRKETPIHEVLDVIARSSADEMWMLFDALAFLSDPTVRRRARTIAQRSTGPVVVFVDPEPTIAGVRATSWIPELWSLALPPPSRAELEDCIDEAACALESAGFADARTEFEQGMDSLVSAATGLERSQLERLLAEAVVEHGTNTSKLQRFIAAGKPAIIDRGGLLTEVPQTHPAQLGGLARYKTWLQRRRLALSPRATEVGIPFPRGVLLLGVQGCGKSLAARATASLLGLPLVRLDIGAVFGSTVGESEANLRQVTDALERIAPVVAWVDEIDKGLAGMDGSSSDAGTSSRVMGGLLTWLAERPRPVFVAATANRVDRLPPELLRRGRLDEVFFIDLPGPEERAEILKVHLEVVPQQRLGRIPPTQDRWEAFAEIARNAEGFSGAELEGALTEARLDALAEQRDLSARDLARAIEATVPLSVARAEDVTALRDWASRRARPAS